MSVNSELKPDRNLLDYNFEGYKLSLEAPITVRHQLECPIERISIDPNNYSFLHAKIFGLHNFLHGETINEYDNLYFVDKNRFLQKISVTPYCDLLDAYNVWEVPPCSGTSDCERYNITLKFVSENLALLNNGTGTLFILNTGDRSIEHEWHLVHSEVLEFKNCYIQDAVLKDTELHVVLCRIEQKDKKALLAINWIVLKNNGTWVLHSSKELLAKGDVSYVQLEKTCEAIYVTSSLGCSFTKDSENPIIDVLENVVPNKLGYKWSQDEENVVIHFILPEDVRKEDVKVTSEITNIKVEYKDKSILEGTLFGRVDSALTTFTLSKNLLEINLIKMEQNQNWDVLLGEISNPIGESFVGGEVKEKLDHMTTEKEEDPPQGLTFNSEQIEECDFSDSELTSFERICVKTHQTTHRYNFGSNGILLTTLTNPNLPLSLGVRNDVDVCLYEPHYNNSNFELKHVATLLAFGYIQASKQQKKFLACPPDASYSIVCKTNRHLFIYRQTKNITSGELKNRKTGARIGTVAQQQVVSLSNEEIYGVYVTNSSIFLLGENFLMHLKIEDSQI